MPYEVQVRLLRVLQEKSVTRIGGKKSIPLNVRVIAATNVNLEEAIENHVFRSDLYYRLNVFSLHIPRFANVVMTFSADRSLSTEVSESEK